MLSQPELNPDGSRPPCWLPDDIPYERWVRHIFDHRVYPQGDRWWWHEREADSTFDYWHPTAIRALGFMTRLFRHSSPLAETYTRAQIDQGLYLLINFYLLYLTGSDDPEVEARDPTPPWEQRRACIAALFNLYHDLLASVYGDDRAHFQSLPKDRPNFALYMWWDIRPCMLYETGDSERVNRAILGVFERVLMEVRAEACLESVLHGLNHAHDDFRADVERIIDRFLAERGEGISDDLFIYAEIAREGRAI